MLVGICGGTGSGKTTIAQKIATQLGKEQVLLLQQDAYYNDLGHIPLESRHHTNFDHPDSLDFTLLIEHVQELMAGRTIEQPLYDFPTHTRTGKYQTVEPCPIILLDGILIFSQPHLRQLMDLRIYIDTDIDIRFIRRLQRDIAERGRTIESVIQQHYTTVRPMHMQLVEPFKAYADIIVPANGETKGAVDLIVAGIAKTTLKLSPGNF